MGSVASEQRATAMRSKINFMNHTGESLRPAGGLWWATGGEVTLGAQGRQQRPERLGRAGRWSCEVLGTEL